AGFARVVTSSFTTDRPPRISLAWPARRAQTGDAPSGVSAREDAFAADLDAAGAEVLARERPHDAVSGLGLVERRQSGTDHVGRHELAAFEAASAVERHPQDRAG